MPIPKPNSGESESEFVSRCISKIIDEYDQSQAAAICYSTYRNGMQKMAKQKLFVLTPKKSENRGTYLSRCSNHPKMRSQFKNIKERMGFCLSSFNEYYKYWNRLEFADIPEKSMLGECITREKAKGFDYKEAYAHCASRIVAKPGPVVMNENLLVEPVEFAEMNILGYPTKYFYLCPGAQATFEHLISMNPDQETQGMIRSAAQIADNIFEIEAMVIKDEKASDDQLNQMEILVSDFYDLVHEIDEELGMLHDVSYMDGHIEKVKSFMNK